MITEYHASYAARARDLCMAGLSESEIATVLGLSIGMLRAWRERYPDFDYAWIDGTHIATTKVVAALFKRACGYDTLVWKETPQGIMHENKHIEPNVSACVFYLTNKHPEHWKSKIEHESAPGGSPPIGGMSDIEAARRVAFALSKAIYEQGRSIEDGEADPKTGKE